MQFQPKNLRNIAGETVGKSIKSIDSLNIPLECKQFLGLIELNKFQSEITIDTINYQITTIKGSNVRILDSKIYLNIYDTEYFTKKSFLQLIEEKQMMGLPFILVLVKLKYGDQIIHQCYDAHSFNDTFQNDDVKVDNTISSLHIMSLKKCMMSFSKTKKIKFCTMPLEYFTIDSINTKGNFLCHPRDLYNIELLPGSVFRMTFFEANKGSLHSQFDLANKYAYRGDIKNAIHYYSLSASKGHEKSCLALCNIFIKNNEFEYARYYCKLLSNNGYHNNNNFGFIYESERNFDCAEQCYLETTGSNMMHAQYNLCRLYERKNDITKRNYHLLGCLEKYSPTVRSHFRMPEPFFTMDHNYCIYGLYNEKHNDLYKAKKAFEKATELNNITAHYHLGLLLCKEGNVIEAKHHLSIATADGYEIARIELEKLDQKN